MKRDDVTVLMYLRRFSNDLSITYSGLGKATGLRKEALSAALINLRVYQYIKVVRPRRGRHVYLLDRRRDTDNFKKLTGSKKVVTLSDILVINDSDDSMSTHDFRIMDFP